MAFRFALIWFYPFLDSTRILNRLIPLLCLLALTGCSGTTVLNALMPGFGCTRQAGVVSGESTGLSFSASLPLPAICA